jgi:hypothetical protein
MVGCVVDQFKSQSEPPSSSILPSTSYMSLSEIYAVFGNNTSTKTLPTTESTSIPFQHQSKPSTVYAQHQAMLGPGPSSSSSMVSSTSNSSLSNIFIAFGDEVITESTQTSNQCHPDIRTKAIEHPFVLDSEPPSSPTRSFHILMITDLSETTSSTMSPPMTTPMLSRSSKTDSACEEDLRPAPPVDKRRYAILDTGCSLFMFANTLESCDNITSTRRTINGIGGTLIATQQGELMGGEVIKTPYHSNNVNVFGTGNWTIDITINTRSCTCSVWFASDQSVRFKQYLSEGI